MIVEIVKKKSKTQVEYEYEETKNIISKFYIATY